MTFFTNGIFTLDGPTATLVFTLSNLFTYLLMLTVPQVWKAHVYNIVMLIIYIVAIVAIIKRNKPILNVCFWINIVIFALLSLWCIIEIPSYLYSANTLAYFYEDYGFALEHVLTTYIGQTMELYVRAHVAHWFSSFIYLCALNAARAECAKASTIILNNSNVDGV